MINFSGKLCLAPMVRSGELPMRLATLRNGADIVWTPELVDKKLIQTTRIINSQLNTIDYIYNDPQNVRHKQSVVFRTLPNEEQGKLILQLGSADPELAVKASLKVIHDVDGIDLNCGCPKNFSIHSGMGAALLSTPDLLCSILRDLVEKVGKPFQKSISCKIRLLDDYETTRSLIERICQTGINNLTIHCRQRQMRNRQDIIWNYLPKLIPYIQSQGISVIINGGLLSYQDFKHLQTTLQNDRIGGMIAESAETNYSVFNKHGPSFQYKNVCQFFNICKLMNQDGFPNTKYMILNQVPGKSPYYAKIAKCKTYDAMEELLQEDELKEDKFFSKIFIRDLTMTKFYKDSKEFDEYLKERKSRWEPLIKSYEDSETVIEPVVIDPRNGGGGGDQKKSKKRRNDDVKVELNGKDMGSMFKKSRISESTTSVNV
ncbi:hypothetical protein DFJ63DRAFT_22383 [Scheffersomyces coipomensis]|uniref:uncharacterized protein n=1 Tax=Scheffersomyces coipomensis TaxID=1788519 RepID=UPI00315DBCAE